MISILELVTEESEKRKVFETIKEIVKKEAVNENKQYVSFRPAKYLAVVYWFDFNTKKLWISFNEDENEFGFGCGFFDYIPNKSISLKQSLRQSVWIGVSKKNYSDKRKQKGGIYAKYLNIPIEEKFVVLHTGKIGGGVKGVGKKCFWKYWQLYKYETKFVENELFAFVCEYDKNNPATMIEQLFEFVMRVNEIRDICRETP